MLPVDAVAGPICHSGPRSQPSELSEKSSDSQVSGPEPPPQVPAEQNSPTVHSTLSSHAIPSFAGVPPTQEPARQVVAAVHGLPSSQDAPSLPATGTHASNASLHMATKHPPGAGHCLAVPPWHEPA